MTAALLLSLAMLVVAMLLLLLTPLRGPLTETPQDEARDALLEEQAALLAAISELDAATARGEADPAQAERERHRLKGRAARVLAQLDTLPPPVIRSARSPVRPAAIGLGLAGLVTLVGAFTFLPRWQLASLAPAEGAAVQSALRVPALERRAARSGRVEDQLALGRAAWDARRLDQALTAYSQALRQNPREPEALRRVGMVLISRDQQPQEAAKLVQAAAKLAPNDPESQLFLGFTYNSFGQPKDALTALERYQKLKPDGREADDLIANLRAQQDGGGSLGERVYAQNCASCHGPAGRGGLGPNLRLSALTREANAAIIKNGKGTMPGFPQIQGQNLEALLDLLDGWRKAGN